MKLVLLFIGLTMVSCTTENITIINNNTTTINYNGDVYQKGKKDSIGIGFKFPNIGTDTIKG
jgi:hypothetical protein